MRKWSLPESDDVLPLGRVILAGLGGHCLAAFAFVFTYAICFFCHEFASKGLSIFADEGCLDVIRRTCKIIYLTALLALPGVIIISPSLLVTLPITLFVVAFLRTGAIKTSLLGAIVGVLVGVWLVLLISGFHEIWMFLISSAAGGIAFAWVVRMTCIRPFRKRLAEGHSEGP